MLETKPQPVTELPLIFQDWGLIDYQKALEQQLALVEEVHTQNTPGYLISCTHPPIVTLGRSTQEGDVFAWQGETIEIARGGRATYHGPSQLVIYPILNLKSSRRGRKPQEVAGYLRALEDGIIEWLAQYGLVAEGKSLQKKSQGEQTTEETGVWLGPRKIASLGIGVKKWITYHGAAINLDRDPHAFLGMNPCGFRREVMISLEEALGRKIERTAMLSELKAILTKRL